MKIFGEFTLHNCDNNDELYRLHNPVGDNMWGVELDDGRQVVPPDNLVTDLSSSPRFVWTVFPPNYGKRQAVFHDFGTRAHKYSKQEIETELTPWFDYQCWTVEQRSEYISWLQTRRARAWHDDYYKLLCLYSTHISKLKKWLAWKSLILFGWWAWGSSPQYRTMLYRQTQEVTKRTIE